MKPADIAEHDASHLDVGLVLAPVWVLLGMIDLTLRGAGMGVAAALTVLGILQLVFGAGVFWTHGGRQITAAGVYSMSSSIFVGFAAIYYAALYGSDAPRSLYLATVLCYFSHVAMYTLFWRTSYPPERGFARVHPPEQMTAWLGRTGLVLLVTALAAHLAGIGVVVIDSMAFVSLVFLACASFYHPGGPAGRPWYPFAAVIGFVLYSLMFFSGYGRLKLATLGIVFAAAACCRFRRRTVKLITLISLPGALLVFGAMRVAFLQKQYGQTDTSNGGIDSVINPLFTFGQLIEGVAGRTIEHGHGSTFVATLFLYVPRSWWEGKPIGFGAVLAKTLLKPGTYGAGTSLAALSPGEWFYDFGVLGIVLMVGVLGLAIRWLDGVLRRALARPLDTRNVFLLLAAALIAVAGMSDLMWVGTFTFNERGGTRLVVILVIAFFTTDVLWRRLRARKIALTVTGTVTALALSGCASSGVASSHAPPVSHVPPALNGQQQVVHLTETLVVSSGDVIRDTHYVWDGPPSSPMVRLAGAQFTVLDHLVFDVPDGHHATAAVQLANASSGGPLGNQLSNLRIGSFGVPGNLDYGLLWTDSVNGDSNTITNVAVFGAARAGISVSNVQATANTFRGVYVFNAPIGLHSEAGGTIECENCGFIGSTDVDVELTNGAGLILTGMYSEHSRSFARVTGGPGAGGLSVLGGYWQWSTAAVGSTITGQNTCCSRSWLRLTDFMVTPLDGQMHGTISGFTPGIMFLSNAAGFR